ncbi:caspase family protein [Streptomyces sp. P9(2023)]|uniref:caspase family protein n=1 Tax=Streptomyces sp. P9(2023) TaxID=3064394 RepID=UPI0028F4230D|nr:caspase family protein [Streptomyces sp. P9(2023)]MDT9691274.1 caspase family protein [Streptomyces sp. P9(2023)]
MSTHALVIGVGKYTHLDGGESPTTHVGAAGMRQLSSPPLSAREFVTWLINGYNEPLKPLASVALLLSEAIPSPFVHPTTHDEHVVQAATIENIEAAVREWKRRGDADEDHRLIFYFCGHGVSQGVDVSLFASDMFADEENPFNGALDFGGLWRGLNRCLASQQIFFVDACRASSDRLISQFGTDSRGKVPIAGGEDRPEGSVRKRQHAVYYSTLDGEKSHARPDSVSLFTEPLIRSLKGPGSQNIHNNVWRVSVDSLSMAMRLFMAERQFAGRVPGVQVPVNPEAFNFDFHVLTHDPVVPVFIGCDPADDNDLAEFVLRRSGQQDRRRGPVSEPETRNAEWAQDLPLGTYEIKATVGLGDVRTASLVSHPPIRHIGLAKP